MQAAGDTLMPGIVDRFVGGSRRMFNQGTNGRWRGVLSDGDLALYEAKVRDKFSTGLAAWIEGGRLGAGDPQALD
jgi:aryl sulfotransferase